MVVAVVGLAEAEESVGVIIVAKPCCAEDVELAAFAGREIGFPLLIVEFNVDAEFGFPHLLNGDGNCAMRFAGVVE